MRQYSKDPVGAEFVFAILGKSPVDDDPIALRVTFASGVYYTTWTMAGETVYRRQYSGRNVDKLRESIDELAEGMVEPHMIGRRDLFLGQDECTLAADDGELFVTPQPPRELSLPHDKPFDAEAAQRAYRANE